MKIGQIKLIPVFEFTFQPDAKSMSAKEQNGVFAMHCPLNVGDEISVNSTQYLIIQKDGKTNPFTYTAKMCNPPLNGMEIISTDKILKERIKSEVQDELGIVQSIIDMSDNILRQNFESLEQANKAINRFTDTLHNIITLKNNVLEDLKEK